jgi:hypothetical protein
VTCFSHKRKAPPKRGRSLAIEFSAPIRPCHSDGISVCVALAELSPCTPDAPSLLNLGLPKVPEFVSYNKHRHFPERVERELDIPIALGSAIGESGSARKSDSDQGGACGVEATTIPIRFSLVSVGRVLDTDVEVRHVRRLHRSNRLPQPVRLKRRVVLQSHSLFSVC